MKEIKIDMAKDAHNSLIILSNSIARAKYSFSLATQKILFFLFSKITYEERKNQLFMNSVEVDLEDVYTLISDFGRSKSKDRKGILKDCVAELGKNNIRWSKIIPQAEKEIWVEFPWFTKAEINEVTGKFAFEFNDKLTEYLLPLQSYFKSDVKEYLQIKSSHSISLYTLFRANEFQKSIQTYYIEELKKHLGVEKKYPRWVSFKDTVLDPSMVQLNKETNYFFTYETKRIGRSIGKIEIRVIDKKNKEEFSDYFSDKIQEFLKKEKVEASVRRNFQLVKYEYEAGKNCIYISFKNEKILKDFISSNPMFGVSNTSSSDILNELLDKYIVKNKDFQRYLKSMFRKDLKIYYK